MPTSQIQWAQGYDLTAFTLAPVTVAAATGIMTIGTPISIVLFHKQSDFANSPELVNIENSSQTDANMVTRRNRNYRLSLTELLVDNSPITGGLAVPSILWKLAGPNATSDVINAIWTKGGVVFDFIGRIENLTDPAVSGENAATLTLAHIALTGRNNPTMVPNA